MKNNSWKILLFITILSIFIGSPRASSTPTLCSQILNPSVSSTSPSSGASGINYTSLGGLIAVSGIILLMMTLVIAILFAVGYAFKIEKLTRFAKAEMGEIVITVLIVAIFLGTLAAVNSASIGGTFSPGVNTYTSVCDKLTNSSVGLISPLIGLWIDYDIIALGQSFTINFLPQNFGFSVEPLSGLSLILNILNIFMTLAIGIIGLLLGVAIVLIVIFAVFPVFLFLGIVLRTLPWSRAAGGAFLGLFIGFYIFLPLLLNLLLVNVVPVMPSNNISLLANSLKNSTLSNGTIIADQAVAGVAQLNPISPINFLIQEIITPVLYSLFAILISFILAFDFTETVGDFLGSESLSSKHTLRNII